MNFQDEELPLLYNDLFKVLSSLKGTRAETLNNQNNDASLNKSVYNNLNNAINKDSYPSEVYIYTL